MTTETRTETSTPATIVRTTIEREERESPSDSSGFVLAVLIAIALFATCAPHAGRYQYHGQGHPVHGGIAR